MEWIIKNWEAIVRFFGIVSVIFIGGVRIYKKIVRPFLDWLKGVNKAIAELNINSGKSIKDKVNSTADTVNSMLSIMKMLVVRQDASFYLSPIPQYECDPSGLCLKVNKAWCELTGLTEDDASGDGWIKAIYKDDRDLVMNEWEKAMKNHSQFDLDYRIFNKSKKEEYPVRGVAIATRNESGAIIRVFGIVDKA